MSLLDDLLGKHIRNNGGALLTDRKTLNIIGATLADNTTTGETDLTINGGSPIGAAGGDLAGTYPNPTVGTNKVDATKFRQSAALSVVGNAFNATNNVADIVAGTDGQALVRTGSSLGFAQLLTAGITDAAVTLAKLANLAALSVIGNATNGSAVPTAISAGTDGQILRRLGTAIGFGKILTNFVTGTSTNDNATAGDIGDYLSSSVPQSAPIPLANSTARTINTLSLPPGDWDITAVFGYKTTSNPTATAAISGIASVTNSITGTVQGDNRIDGCVVPSTTSDGGLCVSSYRVSLSTTTSFYQVALWAFSAGNISAYGRMSARRPR